MGYLAEVEVRKYGHRFEVGVDEETAKVLVSIDGGEPENAKALQDGKVVFFGDREIIVKGEIKLIRYVDLADADFAYLRAAVDRIKIDQAASKEAKKAAQSYRSQIASWKRKVRRRRLPDKSWEKYAIHYITIGADHYSFFEHVVPQAEETIVINPNYRLTADVEGAGGRVARYGELFVWEYYTEEKGWYIIRELSMNEKICVALIYDGGYFAKNSIKAARKTKKKDKKEKNNGEGAKADGKKGIRLFKVFRKDK